ncbi:MAG: hypothetical protein HQ559_02585, partial [Lentisphaerae bacterium]|nr:hypothetical protein [Lentisphaerota bacterium]
MKMVLLFDKEVRRRFNLDKAIPAEAFPDFTPYDYGPFSADVFGDIEFLVELGFVVPHPAGAALPEEEQEYSYWQAGSSPDGDDSGPETEEQFSLTEVGRSFVADELERALTKAQWQTIDEFKARCTAVPLRSLLRYVYSKYPEQTTHSTIREEILAGYDRSD